MIAPGCKGPSGETLALAATEDGQIVVQDASMPTSGLWWTLIYDVATQSFAMINALSVELGKPSALALSGPVINSGEIQLTLSPIGAGLSNLMTWNVEAISTALAVRPTLSAALNLNVAGNGPYPPGSAVIAYYDGTGGQPNEIWTFQDQGGENYPWAYTFAAQCAPDLLLTADEMGGTGPLSVQYPRGDSASPLQLWDATYRIEGTNPIGVVFVNQEFSMMLRTTPGGGTMFCVDTAAPDAWDVWLTGPAPDNANMTTIRAMAEQGLYWNVSGTGPYNSGNAVISYPWQGGQPNELWTMTYVPPQIPAR
jgi:hypothetical protein